MVIWYSRGYGTRGTKSLEIWYLGEYYIPACTAAWLLASQRLAADLLPNHFSEMETEIEEVGLGLRLGLRAIARAS